MKTVKQTAEYTILQRRDGRYAVRSSNKNPVNGDEKVEILVKEGLIEAKQKSEPKAQEESSAAETGAEENAAEETGEET